METLRNSIFAVSLIGLFLLASLALVLHAMFMRGIRRYERALVDTYSERFEQRTVVAKSVHPHLAQVIHRSKSLIDEVRQKAVDGPEATDALNEVSEWLTRAEGESDRALRSLESGRFRAFNNDYILRGEHVDTQTDSHNDR